MSSPSNVPSQARSIATRARLLASAVDALVADGYAGASTTSIAKRAEVSQGALFKHFPSKHALLGEALQQLFTELVALAVHIGEGQSGLAMGITFAGKGRELRQSGAGNLTPADAVAACRLAGDGPQYQGR